MHKYCVHYSAVHDHDVWIKAESAKEAARAVAMRYLIPLDKNPNIELIKDDVWNRETTPEGAYQVTGADIVCYCWFNIDKEGTVKEFDD